MKLIEKLVARLRSLPEHTVVGTSLAAIIALVYVFWVIFEDPESTANVKDGLTSIGGLVVLVGLYIAYRRVQVQQDQLQVQQGQLQVQERGQITDRYSKAIEQLADKELAIRLGGIFALEKIALDNPADYHGPVAEVLCAFLRERHPATEIPDEASGTEDVKRPQNATENYRVPTQVQAICEVLSRLNSRSETGRVPMNLSGVNMQGIRLTEGNLAGANLVGANLYKANLYRANLFGADLLEVNLRRANLFGASLERADLEGADLRGANLRGANLERANLFGANLFGAYLAGVNLRRAELERANLEEVLFEEDDLEWVYLKGTLLEPKED